MMFTITFKISNHSSLLELPLKNNICGMNTTVTDVKISTNRMAMCNWRHSL